MGQKWNLIGRSLFGDMGWTLPTIFDGVVVDVISGFLTVVFITGPKSGT